MNTSQDRPGTGNEGAGIGDAFAIPTERLKEIRRDLESLFDPFGMVAPIVHAQAAWWLHPLEFAGQASRAASDIAALQLHTAARMAGHGGPDVVQPQADDTRFTAPVWNTDPGCLRANAAVPPSGGGNV